MGYRLQDPRTLNKIGYSLDPLEQANSINGDDLAILQDVLDRREQKARTAGYQRPVHDFELFAANNTNQMAALAKALSNMSSSAGTYQGKSPSNMGFENIVDDFDAGIQRDLSNRLAMEARGDKMLLENIGLRAAQRKAEEEAKEKKRLLDMENKPLAEYDRIIAEKAVQQIMPDYKLPENLTYGELRQSELLSPLAKRMGSSLDNTVELLRLDLQEQGLNQRAQQQQKELEQRDRQFQQKLEADEKARQAQTKKEQQRQQQKLEAEDRASKKKDLEILKKAEADAAKLLPILDELEQLTQKYGYSEISKPEINTKMKTLSSQALLLLKDENGLGVLNVGDRPILEDILGSYGDPAASIKGTIQDFNLKGAKARLDFIRQQTKKGIEDKRKILGEELSAKVPKVSEQRSAPKFPMRIRKGGNFTTVENEQELKEAQAEGWQ